MSAICVLCTAPDDSTAKIIAKACIEQHVAACVNLVPHMTAIYRWENQIEEASETLLIIKTEQHCFQALEQVIVQHHPYDVPEIIQLPIEAGYTPYLNWVTASVRSPS